MSTFIPLVIMILLSTGWLTFLPAQLEITKQYMIIYLAIIGCISLLPPISITSSVDIQLDYLFLFFLFIYLLKDTSVPQLATLLSLIFMLGSILFLFHEIFGNALIGRSSVFQWVTILLSLGEAIVSAIKLKEQFCLVFGGLLVTQGVLYYLYHERISPLVFPGIGVLDTFWITTVILIVLKGVQLRIPIIQKNWRVAYWIKKR
ncbi:hypothetical protein MK805_16140 [Shimazuella sp. AN120528]|uniref:hypothetical protein n=1 Tax=Shimazuella soli TaxID=1892854 RepID=UPI001F0DFB0E|nr:hypothetical protein [Shimazuella soli]MCH5586471.1 hypothetical protein [Shimazuella soli]